MIKHELEDKVIHLMLYSSHDTDFYCVKPDGTKYVLKVRKDEPDICEPLKF